MEQRKSLQDYVWQNGPLTAMLATGYINEIASALERLHNERHICHLDVRPDMILLDVNGKVTLKESTVSQSYSEQGAETDFRDLKAVHHYLLTGKKPSHIMKHDGIGKTNGNSQSSSDDNTETSTSSSEQVTAGSTKSLPIFAAILLVAFCLTCGFLYFKKKTSLPTKKTETVARGYNDFYYEGQWTDGKPNGIGTAKYKDGRFYEGHFLKGKWADKNARFIYADGNVFVGTFADDTIQCGKVTLKEGGFYFVGDFSDGKPFNGSWYNADGKEVEIVKKGKEIVL